FDRETIGAPMSFTRHFREGVIAEELMLDTHRQVSDPALHPEGVVVAQQREVYQHHFSGRGDCQLSDESLAQRQDGGHELWIEVALGSQPLQEEVPRLVPLAAFLVDPHPVFLAANALPPFHRAVGRARVPTELLGRGPGLVQRFGAGALQGAPLRVIHHVRHVQPPSLAGGVRRAPVAGTMRVDAVAVAARWRSAWRPRAHLERTSCAACRGPASVGTNRGHGASRRRSGTWAYHSAAIPAGGCQSGADPRRSSVARAGDGTPYPPSSTTKPPCLLIGALPTRSRSRFAALI